MGVEQPSSYYDKVYVESEEYSKPFYESRYFDLWNEILRMIEIINPERIIDFGCGVGQFAQMLHSKSGIRNYVGVDFSEVAIRMCKERNLSGYEFKVGESKHLLFEKYNMVLLLEVLEHISNDEHLINSIASGTSTILTVPCFDDTAHVRYFENEKFVMDRYGKYFDDPVCDKFDRWFILSGTKK